MAKRSVEIIIAGRDAASKIFNKVGRSVKILAGKIRVLSRGLGRGFSGATIKALRFAKVGLVAVAAGYGIATRAAIIQEDAERKLAAAIKSTGAAAGFTLDEFKDYASELQKVTKFGDEATLGTIALLSTFTKIKGPIFKEAIATIQDISTLMGTQMKDSAIQVGKALNDPLLGITALSRVGITFSEDQKKVIKGFVKLNDIASAQRVILKELAVQFGGQARAAAQTAGGALVQMKNAIGDIVEVIGQALLPGMVKSAIAIKEWAENNQKAIGIWAKKAVANITLVKDILGSFITFLRNDWVEGFRFGAKAALDILVGMGKSVSVVVKKIMTDVIEVILSVFNEMLLNAVENGNLLAQALLTPIIEGMEGFKTKNRKDWQEVGEDIQDIMGKTFDNIKSFTPKILLADFQGDFAKFKAAMEEINKDVAAPKLPGLAGLIGGGGAGGAGGGGAARFGGGRLAAREFRFTRSAPGRDPMQQLQKNTERTAKATEKMVKNMDTELRERNRLSPVREKIGVARLD